MIDISVKEDNLIIVVKGLWTKILSLSDSIIIPLEKIANINDVIEIDRYKTVKIMGTRWRSLYAGTFYVFGKGKVFYLFKNKDKCIRIITKNSYRKYRELILQLESRDYFLNYIQNKLK